MIREMAVRVAGVLVVLVVALAGPALAAEPARVYFISPQDGEVTKSPVTVRFGLSGMGVAPAGVDRPGTGHHHLLINVADLPPLEQPIPADERHRHFGGGQTEAEIELPPGTHVLRLLLGDHNHVPHDPPLVSDEIRITVEP